MDLIKINNLTMEADLKTLNAKASDDIIRYTNDWSKKYLNQLVTSTPSLKIFLPFVKLDSDFWKKRNETMSKNILNFAKIFKGKKILIITGNAHRYFLLDLLKLEQKKYKFEIKEYYEK